MTLREIELLAAAHARERDAELQADPSRKRRHGVVHTPPELARLVVRGSHQLLKSELTLAAGIADPALQLLDPACGPGAFFAAALAQLDEAAEALSTEPSAPLPDAGAAHARDAPVMNGVGFDIDPDALALAERLRVHPRAGGLRFETGDVLASDVVLRAAQAHPGPLLVLGNPPWASARAQASAIDQARLEPFRQDASGARLQERKLGVLSDAYVRFFSLCAEAACATEAGSVVALITNGSYLDGPVHRGMRARLLAWFDSVYVLDLGGSALLGRQRVQRDDNVFGVRPSVSITWLCRRPGLLQRLAAGRLYYARRFGSKEQKLAQLAAADMAALDFRALTPEPPSVCFVPRPRRDQRYESFPALTDWLPFHREGVQSNRDGVVVDRDPDRLLARLAAFVDGQSLPELSQAERRLPHYDPEVARRAVAEALERDPDGQRGIVIQRLAYRPFDDRYFCPVVPLCHRPRPELTRAIQHAPAVLLSVRKDRGDKPWAHAAWSNATVDNCYLSTRSSCRTRAFPSCDPDGRPNLSPQLSAALGAVLGAAPGVLAFQHYCFAILSATSYRTRWNAELLRDYPRIPLPPTAAQFHALATAGEAVAALYTTPLTTPLTPLPAWPTAPTRRDLSLAADGGLRLRGVPLLTLAPGAAQLAIGHHRPLPAQLTSNAPLDAAALRGIVALAERIAAIDHAHHTLDPEVAALLDR
ncbi:MAG: type ISP restriction/modification enzyme [Polyangiales bacterium]